MSDDKRPWHAPELIDVGDASDLTEGMDQNVGEGTNPASWRNARMDDVAEVELENG